MHLTKKQTVELIAFIDKHSPDYYETDIWVARIKLGFPEDVKRAEARYKAFCETTEESDIWAEFGRLDMNLTAEIDNEGKLVHSAYLYPTYTDHRGMKQTDLQSCLGGAEEFFTEHFAAG